ncbi:MAG: hypothetical protein ACREXR_24360, partial [Gammaproteobacteria bacterium]
TYTFSPTNSAEEAKFISLAGRKKIGTRLRVLLQLSIQPHRYRGPILLTCYRYIELNPMKAGMVGDPNDYLWVERPANTHLFLTGGLPAPSNNILASDSCLWHPRES